MKFDFAAKDQTPVAIKAALVPETYDIFLGGGRGGGKTRAILQLAGRHAQQYRQNARIVYLRQSHRSLQEVKSDALLLFTAGDPASKFNKQEGLLTFSNGATLQFDVLQDEKDYADKFQGTTISLLILDEMTAWPDLRILDLMRSNLRKQGTPCQTLMAANPGGISHGAVAERYVFTSPGDMVPFHDEETDSDVVYIHSGFQENQFVDSARYTKQLKASCRGDEALLKAWVTGDWHVVRGAFFGGALTSANKIQMNPFDVRTEPSIRAYLALDHGTRAPFVCYLMLECLDTWLSPSGEYFPKDSLIAVDECTSATTDDLEEGGGQQIPETSLQILEMCAEWNAPAVGFGDDALFADTGVGQYDKHYRDGGVTMRPAKKGRRKHGWALMRELLDAAEEPQAREEPALYLGDRCWYAWQTIPYLTASPVDFEDIAKSRRDHAADALRYGCIRGESGTATTLPAPWAPEAPSAYAMMAMRQNDKAEKIIERLRKRGLHSADLSHMRGGGNNIGQIMRRMR